MFYTADDKEITIKNLFKGQSCFLIASGPSLLTHDLDKLRQPGILTFGMNNSVKAFRPNLWCAVDDIGNFMISIYKDPRIMKFIPQPKHSHRLFDNTTWQESHLKVEDCPNVIYYKRNDTFNHETYLTEDTINWGNSKDAGGGRSVMMAAVRMIHILGFKKLFLLGCDFRMAADYTYSFQQARTKGSIHCNNSTYRKMNERFALLRPLFEKTGFYVFNCCKDSGLKAFDYMPFDEAVNIALKDFPNTETERSEGMYDRQANEREAERRKKQGVIYYNSGKGCLVRLAVSISSCRKFYDGALTILCDKESFDDCKAIADHFKCNVKQVDFSTRTRNERLFNKTLLHEYTPYQNTVYIDADTIVLNTFNKLFKAVEAEEFVVTQFADWKAATGIITKRIAEWDAITDTTEAKKYPYAINTGIFAFQKNSTLMKAWYDLAVQGEKFFIPDEVSCQILLPKFKHKTLGASYNTSCKYGKIWRGTAIIHFHGKKHCRIENGKYLYHSDLWYKEFDAICHLDFVKNNIQYDNKLTDNINIHDKSRIN